MREDFKLLDLLIGLPIGAVPVLIVWYFVVRKGKKERRFDERYKRIQEKAKSIAFGITLLAIVIAGTIVFLFEVGSNIAYFLFITVYVIGIVSYGVSVVLAEKKN